MKTRELESSEGLARDEDPLLRGFIHEAGKLVLDVGRRPQFLTTRISPESGLRLHGTMVGLPRVSILRQKMPCPL